MNKSLLITVLVLNSFAGCLAMDGRGTDETSGMDKLLAAIDLIEQPQVGRRPMPVGAFQPYARVVRERVATDVPMQDAAHQGTETDEARPTAAERQRLTRVVVPSVQRPVDRTEPLVERPVADEVRVPVTVAPAEPMPSSSSMQDDRLEVARFSPGEQNLFHDIFFGNCLHAQEYLDQGVDVHFGDNYLMRVAMRGLTAHDGGHTQAMDWLLTHGYDVHFNDDAPMKKALQRKDFVMMRFLIEHGVDIHFNNDEPMKAALDSPHFATIRFLLVNGFDMSQFPEELFRNAIGKMTHLDILFWIKDQEVPVPDCIIQKIILRGDFYAMCELVKRGIDLHAYRRALVERCLTYARGAGFALRNFIARGFVDMAFIENVAAHCRDRAKAAKTLKTLKRQIMEKTDFRMI